jgi:hypothetical protein
MKKSSKKQDWLTPSANNVAGQPETAFELINKYGTYNIQPTCDSGNDFPKIAQGIESKGKRSKE